VAYKLFLEGVSDRVNNEQYPALTSNSSLFVNSFADYWRISISQIQELITYMFLPAAGLQWSVTQIQDKRYNTDKYSRLSQWFRDTGFHTLDLSWSQTSVGAFVLGTTKSGADRALEIGNGSSNGGSPLATGFRLGHGEDVCRM